MSHTRGRARRWGLLLLSLSLILAACGGDESSPDDGADTPATDDTGADSDTDTDADTDSGDATGDTESYDWQYASYLPPQSGLMIAIEDYFTDIGEQTDGRIEVETFYQESLLGATEIMPGVRDGRAQLGFMIALYHPGELPLSQVVGVPFVTEDAEAQIRAMNDLYANNDAFRAEYDAQGIRVLSFTPLTNSIVATVDPVEGIGDLEGKSIRSVGFLAGAFDAVGANAVALPAPEIFESLERGVIDGFSSYPFDVAVANNMHEAAPYFLEPGTGLYNLGALIISQQTWDSLPEDTQQLMTAAVDDYVENSIAITVEEEQTRCDQLLEQGGTATVLPEADVQQWESEVGDSVLDRWRSAAIDAGVSEGDVDGFYEQYRSTLGDFEEQSSYEPGLRECAARG